MTTRKRIGFAAGAALMTLGITAGVYASAQNTNAGPRPFSGPGGGPGGRIGRGGPMGPGGPIAMLGMMGPLDLTDTQKAQIKTIVDSHRDEWKALADRGRAAHEALHDAITAETVDDGLIRQLSANVAAVEADLAVAQARAHAEAITILTAEQKEKAKAFQAEAKNRMEQRGAGGIGRKRGRGAF